MKYGAHIFLWTDRWSDEELSLFERARELGLECLEIAVGDNIDFNADIIRRQAKSLEMDLVISPGADWPMEMDISLEDATNAEAAMSWHRNWIEKGAAAGAKAYTGAIYGHPGKLNDHLPSEQELDCIAKRLHQLADYAAQYEMELVLEPMSHFRTWLVNRPEQATDLIKRADHNNLKVLFDTYHAVTEIRDFPAAIKTFGSTLWGIHACENDRGAPGNGLIPWDKIFSELRDTQFNGYIILESYNSSIANFAVSRGMFHNVCPDGDAFVKNSLRFLKSKANIIA